MVGKIRKAMHCLPNELIGILDRALPNDFGTSVALRLYQAIDPEYKSMFPEAYADVQDAGVDVADFEYIGVAMSRTGISFAMANVGGQGHAGPVACLYWDGKTIRVLLGPGMDDTAAARAAFDRLVEPLEGGPSDAPAL